MHPPSDCFYLQGECLDQLQMPILTPKAQDLKLHEPSTKLHLLPKARNRRQVSDLLVYRMYSHIKILSALGHLVRPGSRAHPRSQSSSFRTMEEVRLSITEKNYGRDDQKTKQLLPKSYGSLDLTSTRLEFRGRDEEPVHYGTKPGHYETLKIHFPTSEGVSEVSERTSERANE